MTEIESVAGKYAAQTARLLGTGAAAELPDLARMCVFTETTQFVFLLEIERLKASRKLDQMIAAMQEANAELESLLQMQRTLQRQAETLLKTQSKHCSD